jgi:hypothetical protein
VDVGWGAKRIVAALAGWGIARSDRGGARARPSPSYRVIDAAGGVAPRAGRRAAHTLRITAGEKISRALARGQSVRAIARRLDRAASTISREMRRHGGPARPTGRSPRIDEPGRTRGDTGRLAGRPHCECRVDSSAAG